MMSYRKCWLFYLALPWTLYNCLLSLQPLCNECTSRFFSSFITDHRFRNWSSTTGVTSEAEISYPSTAPVLLRFTDYDDSIGVFRSFWNILCILCILFKIKAYFVITLFARWYVRVGIVLGYAKFFNYRIISLRGELYADKTGLAKPFSLKCLYQAMKVCVRALVLTISILRRWLDNDVWIGTCVKLQTIRWILSLSWILKSLCYSGV